MEPAISSSPEHLTSEDDNDIIVIRESDSTIESNNVAGKNNTEDVLSGSEGEDSIESEESEEQDGKITTFIIGLLVIILFDHLIFSHFQYYQDAYK